MKKSSLLALIPMILMLIATFTPIASATGPPQPPVDTTTLHTGTIGWGPVDASPHKAYDTGSGELLFNCYDTLITMGAPVTNLWGTWDVHEQYWEFEPSLATNVPNRQEIQQDFMSIPFVETIYVRNELPLDPDWINDPECTWWEDAMPEPIDSYHLYLWDDGGNQYTGHPPTPGGEPNGVLDFCDWVYMNAYWWAPEVPLEVEDKECQWWHVLDVIEVELGVWIMILEKAPDGGVDPLDPECTWLMPIPPYHPDYDPAIVGPRLYHINGWIDNNPNPPGELGPCDVVYIMEFYNVTVHWESPYGVIEGWILVPITKRTWHIIHVDYGGAAVFSLHRFYYDFYIRTDPVINFIESYTGAIVDTFDIYDVEYSLKKMLVMDHYGSPAWMFYKPLFDTMGSDDWDTGDPADAIELAYLIKDAIEIVSLDPPTLRVNLGIAFPDVAFKQIMSQTWASIQSKEYSISIGCWDGELFLDSGYLPGTVMQNCIPDWFEYWRHMEYGPYEAEWVAGPQVKRYAGTGPYYVGVLSAADNLVVLLSHDIDHCGDDYWKGWPSTANSLVGNRMQDYLREVHIEYIELWATRRAAFEACEIDVCAVPRAFMTDLLDEFGEPINPSIKTIKKISPVLAMAAVFYNFDIAETSTGIYTGECPGGIPPWFFNNTHVRKAFSHAFDRARYLAEAYFGEAICRETPDIYGLEPDYYNYEPDPPWIYGNANYDLAKAELQQAYVEDCCGDELPPRSVWDCGFTVDLLYNTGNDQRRIACYYLRDFFDELSTYQERTGPAFRCIVKDVDWPTYITALIHRELAVFVLGWLADYADADNWKRPYMHTYGDFAYFQGYSCPPWNEPGPRTGLNKDQLIDLAVKTPDGPERATMYADLDDIYIRDCPSLPIAQPTGRRWQKCWVRGWYYNALYPSSYYYHMYKKDTCWSDVTGPTIGMPDGVTNMRDIGYISGHFLESQPPPYDDSWAPGSYGVAGADVYGDRRIDMRDIGYACLHFAHTDCP